MVHTIMYRVWYFLLRNNCIFMVHKSRIFGCVWVATTYFVTLIYLWSILIYLELIWYPIMVITKLPNSEQFSKEKVKTHKYINRQNQSTTWKLWKPWWPSLGTGISNFWWVESDFKAPKYVHIIYTCNKMNNEKYYIVRTVPKFQNDNHKCKCNKNILTRNERNSVHVNFTVMSILYFCFKQ